jgi:hypothetical protein
MANWPFAFRPLPGRFGNMLEFTDTAIGTGGTSVANSATTTVLLPTPFTKCYVDKVSVAAIAAAASSGAVTVQFFKQSGATKTAITAATSIKSDVITGANPAVYGITITATDPVRLFQAGDIMLVDIVAAGTVTTQPTASVQAAYSVVS